MPTADENLATIALFISVAVLHAIQARLVVWAADLFFERQVEKETVFRTNPANTLPYMALLALERESVVHIAEVLRDEHKLYPTTATIRGKADLERHRDALSHPLTVRWRRQDRQEFADTQRVWRDFRPGIIWDMQKSINEELRARGQATRNDDIAVTVEMASMLELILKFAVNAGYGPHDPVALLEWLGRAKEKYVRLLDAHPDGQV
jgi:hypothetical protein